MVEMMAIQQAQSKKRKYNHEEEDDLMMGFSMEDQLNQDLLEKVLSWLPTSSFYRSRSVCKRWNSVAESASFRLACQQVPTRDPWFFMVDNSHLDQSIVFDTSQSNWKHLNNKRPRRNREIEQQSELTTDSSSSRNDLIPVASSGGLVCFRSTSSGAFLVSNPVTGASRELPAMPATANNQNIHAISMNSISKQSYRLVLVSGELPNLTVSVYESGKDCWEEEIKLKSKAGGKAAEGGEEDDSADAAGGGGGDEVLYFLSKTGDVVATNMQRSPSKQYSSVIAVKDGQEIIYFLSSSGTVYPRMLPVCYEYSIDVVECRGEMLVIVLSEFLETASLRVWRFSEEEKEEKDRTWRQIAVMPPNMSHELYGKKADINCVGSGDEKLMICVNSSKVSRYLMCDLETNGWTELPECVVDGKPKEFMSAFSFEPRIEARV
ncbi:hypothetical protein MKW92_004017 [Papaver armeniacum]|nr:hypothetical protein MKW92_004017 [Papaver armeniacum]